MSDTETKPVYATLVRGEIFTIVKTKKKFEKGKAKKVTAEEVEILEAQVEQVRTNPGTDDEPEFADFAKFTFGDKPAKTDDADEAPAPRARTRAKV